MEIDGAKVLDLFAGFGSLGYEALSRGAAEVCFVDRSIHSLKSLRGTASALGITSGIRILNKDVVSFIRSADDTYDLVFCDPPYNWRDYNGLIRGIFNRGLITDEGLLLIEHSNSFSFENEPYFFFDKDYGMTRVTFFSRTSA